MEGRAVCGCRDGGAFLRAGEHGVNHHRMTGGENARALS